MVCGTENVHVTGKHLTSKMVIREWNSVVFFENVQCMDNMFTCSQQTHRKSAGQCGVKRALKGDVSASQWKQPGDTKRFAAA